jgi:hypothetical protein
VPFLKILIVSVLKGNLVLQENDCWSKNKTSESIALTPDSHTGSQSSSIEGFSLFDIESS